MLTGTISMFAVGLDRVESKDLNVEDKVWTDKSSIAEELASTHSAIRRIVPECLETPRPCLRMFQESDWDPLSQMLSDKDCVRYTIKTPLTKWQSWRYLAGYLGHWHLRGYGPYAVVERSSTELAGAVGLWYPGDWPEPEIKWSLRKAFWRKGYATEAASAVKDMAARELGWNRLISLILRENEASKSVAKRLGGVYERTIPFRSEEAEIFVYELGGKEKPCQSSKHDYFENRRTLRENRKNR